MNGTDPCPRCGNPMDSQWHKWPLEDARCKFRDESNLTPDLVGLEGWRVEVRDPDEADTEGNVYPGLTRRFYVGKSTGWRPCHLEIHNRRSTGGGPARKEYASVTRLYKR